MAILGLIVVLALVAGAAWRFLGSTDVAAVELTDESPLRPSAQSSTSGPIARPLDSTAAQASEAPRSTATNEATSTSNGRYLTVTVVDDATDEPIADLPVQAFREQGGDALLGEAITDENGRVSFDELDRDLVLVETRRRVPYAATLGAAWIPKGERKSLELRVGRGGRATGRVVDDLGEPIEGATLHLSRRSWGDHSNRTGTFSRPFDDEVVAVTDALGRYAIEAVESRPAGVWLLEDGPRPERWIAIGVAAKRHGVHENLSRQVAPGDEIELPDIVLNRASHYVGRVLDHNGRAVSEATVTAGRHSTEVRFGTAMPALDPSHVAKTDANGHFGVLLGHGTRSIRVETIDGRREYFDVPQLEPGATSEELELRLHAATRVRLFLSVDGKFVHPDKPRGLKTKFKAERLDGETLTAYAEPDGEAVWVSWPCEPRELVAFEFTVNRFRKARHEFLTPPHPNQDITIELEPLPKIRFEIVTADLRDHEPWISDPGYRSKVYIDTCLGSAARRGEDCCGLGSFCSIELGDQLEPIELPVQSDEPYWIHVYGKGVGAKFPSAGAPNLVSNLRGLGHVDDAEAKRTQSFGPFLTGETTRSVRLDIDFSAFADDPTEEETKEPPAPSSPADAPDTETGTVTATIVDASTDLPLEAHGLIDIEYESGRWMSYSDYGAEIEPKCPLGSWTIEISCSGYESQSFPVTVTSGTPFALGEVRLVPRPTWRAQFVPGDDWRGEVRALLWPVENPGDGPSGAAWIDEIEDTWTAGYEQVPASIVQVSSWNPARAQRTRVPSWSEDEVLLIELSPWRDVAIDVVGIPEQHAKVKVRLRVFLTPSDSLTTPDALLTPDPEGDGIERRFRFATAAGRYIVRAWSAVYDFDPLEIDVADVDELQVFTLRAR